MEDHHQNNTSIETTTTSSSNNTTTNKERSNNNSEPVRSRWTPKPEQILILESIFNSGMVNPPKEETVRIRKMLEKFGAVGDANVFYWFQNRRSRSRRRQRKLQASFAAATAPSAPTPQPLSSGGGGGGGSEFYDFGTCTTTSLPLPTSTCFGAPTCSTSIMASPNNSTSTNSTNAFGGVGVVDDDVFGTTFCHGQLMGSTINLAPPHQLESNSSQILDASNLDHHFGSGIITVFINGVATQLPEGPLDVKAMFGEEVILVHSSGVPVPFNEFGISFQSLQHGESYFLVPRLT